MCLESRWGRGGAETRERVANVGLRAQGWACRHKKVVHACMHLGAYY